MPPIRFGIAGAGWRALFYLRIARELPDRFRVTGILTRSQEKADNLHVAWGVQTALTLPELLRTGPSFVVTSVPWDQNPVILRDLAQRGVPALSETPPAPTVESMTALHRELNGAKIQVAEQYRYQPMHAARISISRSGRLGEVTQAQVSVAHGYHGVNLIRALLGVDHQECVISARRFASPIVAGPDRSGPPTEERISSSDELIALLDFGGKLGVFDFTGEQYFSWIRSSRVLVRGDRGEVHDTTVRYLLDFRTPVTLPLIRHDLGHDMNLEGYCHRGITAGAEWVYRNPFQPGRLSDDEIAVATCLLKMAEYVEGGEGPCSLADACQDHYLGILIDRAAASGAPVRAEKQPWAERHSG